MDNLAPNTCLNCRKTLVGRSDKKFCDAYCRNSFNNQHKAKAEQHIALVNSQIRRNRRILKDLCPEGKATVRKEILDQLGYRYEIFSGLYKSNTLLYYLVYDYGFAPIFEKGIEKALIIQRQDYMDKLGFDIWQKPHS